MQTGGSSRFGRHSSLGCRRRDGCQQVVVDPVCQIRVVRLHPREYRPRSWPSRYRAAGSILGRALVSGVIRQPNCALIGGVRI